MKYYDITRELFSAPVYPGDPAPSLQTLCRLEYGDMCNTSALTACVHNGTHMDAPLHFLAEGRDIAQISLEMCIGECSVIGCEGLLVGDQTEKLLPRMRHTRILLKGNVQITSSAAFVLANADIRLLGVEAPSVTSVEYTGAVHRQLLDSGMVLLEGLDLSKVMEGDYFLFAAPLKMAGAEGAPVRAVLLAR